MTPPRTIPRSGLIIALGACLFTSARAAEPSPNPSPEAIKFFESSVRPLLIENCQSCHGEKKQKGGLRLDSAASLAKGGKNGPILSLNKPSDSKILLAISYKDKDLQMPPEEALPADKVAILTRWVQMGAPFPASTGIAVAAPPRFKKRIITDADRTFWSFQPPQDQSPPAVKDAAWCRNEVDRFVLAKLESENLTPAPEADRRTLIRRAYLDLWGLPPTPEEVDAFLADQSADAWEKLIDKLLASPRYGERWARHWLDLVRYAESDGYKQDAYRASVFPYRDYVIRSFNSDKPYDRFITEQLAGDELDPNNPDVFIGTAYFRHGIYEYNQADVRTQWNSILDEITDVTSDAVLGLSMGCARCHDHKFDPILQKDYFKLRAFFAPIVQRHDLPLATPAQKAQYAAALAKWEDKTTELRDKIESIEKAPRQRAIEGAINKFPPEIRDLIHKPAAQRTPLEEQLVQLGYRQVIEKSENVTAKLTGKAKEEYDALRQKLIETEKEKPAPLPEAFIATDVGPAAPPMFIPGHDKEPLDPGYPTVLDSQPLKIPDIKPTDSSTGRRTALAAWLTQPNHPLTTRVAVNRAWQYHFGRGLVGTSSDYGKLGDHPTHPELLDFLARRFLDGGWKFKSLHRLILTSATYRQSSTRPMPEVAKMKDPDNRFLWKFTGHRLDAEQIRDAMLLASGELKFDMFGPAVDAVSPRRSVYTKVWRNVRDPVLDAFDLPDAFGSSPSRNSTTTATQSLLMINGDWPLRRAQQMAGRIQSTHPKSPEEAASAAWRIAYDRPPTKEELTAATQFLTRPQLAQSAIRNPQSAIAPPTPDSALSTQDSPANSPDSLDTKPVVKMMPQTGSQAILIRQARPDDMLRLPTPTGMPSDDFTIEAVILLDSIYEDASVRVIASQWDGNQKNPGWSLGVTSQRSKHEPRNLILQLACDPSKPGGGYEVIASEFRIELHKTYYVAVSFKLKDTSESGVTFYLKDITDMDAPLKSTSLAHKLTGAYANSKSALIIGGRDGPKPHGWDGLIDDVRISRKALTKEQLLYSDPSPSKTNVVGYWSFEDQPGIMKDSAGVQKELAKLPAAPNSSAGASANAGSPKTKGSSASSEPPAPKADPALIDLCHILLNSNEFLYMD